MKLSEELTKIAREVTAVRLTHIKWTSPTEFEHLFMSGLMDLDPSYDAKIKSDRTGKTLGTIDLRVRNHDKKRDLMKGFYTRVMKVIKRYPRCKVRYKENTGGMPSNMKILPRGRVLPDWNIQLTGLTEKQLLKAINNDILVSRVLDRDENVLIDDFSVATTPKRLTQARGDTKPEDVIIEFNALFDDPNEMYPDDE